MDRLWTTLMYNNLRSSDHSLKKVNKINYSFCQKKEHLYLWTNHTGWETRLLPKGRLDFCEPCTHEGKRQTINGLSSNPHGWVDDKIDNGTKLIVDFSLLYYSSTQALLATLKQWTMLLNSSRTFKSSIYALFSI